MIQLLFVVCVGVALAGDVITVTDKNWKKEVVDSPLPVFVKFYAPWCGHCKSLAPTWDKVATNLKGLVQVVKVDCTTEGALCQKFGVQGYPTLKLFKDKAKTVKDYQQGRDASSLVKFATGELPNNVVSIKDEATLDSFLAKNADLPHVVLFSQKKEVPALFKALSAVFSGKLVLGQVPSSVKAVVDKYGPFEAFPKIIVLQPSGEKVVYDGAVNVAAVKEFLAQYAGEASGEPAAESTPQQKPVPKVVVEPAKWQQVNSDDVNKHCGKLCVLAFVQEQEGKPVAEQQKVLDTVLKNFSKDKKFKFVWASLKELDLHSKFGGPVDQPLALVFNSLRSKYAKAENFDTESITQLLERTIGGDVTYEKLEA